MTKKRLFRGRSFWVSTVQEFRASGLSQREFALSQGLSPSTLSRWVGVLAKEGRGPRRGRRGRRTEARFVEVEVKPAPPRVRIEVGTLTMAFDSVPPVEFVVELARALGPSC